VFQQPARKCGAYSWICQSERAALADRSMNLRAIEFCASNREASGVSLAHAVAFSCRPSASLAAFSLFSIYQAAAFFAPSTLKHASLNLLKASNNPSRVSFSATVRVPPSSPWGDFLRGRFPLRIPSKLTINYPCAYLICRRGDRNTRFPYLLVTFGHPGANLRP
jgi:hypothetical protein